MQKEGLKSREGGKPDFLSTLKTLTNKDQEEVEHLDTWEDHKKLPNTKQSIPTNRAKSSAVLNKLSREVEAVLKQKTEMLLKSPMIAKNDVLREPSQQLLSLLNHKLEQNVSMVYIDKQVAEDKTQKSSFINIVRKNNIRRSTTIERKTSSMTSFHRHKHVSQDQFCSPLQSNNLQVP